MYPSTKILFLEYRLYSHYESYIAVSYIFYIYIIFPFPKSYLLMLRLSYIYTQLCVYLPKCYLYLVIMHVSTYVLMLLSADLCKGTHIIASNLVTIIF